MDILNTSIASTNNMREVCINPYNKGSLAITWGTRGQTPLEEGARYAVTAAFSTLGS